LVGCPATLHGAGLGLFESFAELLDGTAVLLLGEGVSGGDEDGDGPVDDFQREEDADRAIVGQLLGARQSDGTQHGQVQGDVLGLFDLLRCDLANDMARDLANDLANDLARDLANDLARDLANDLARDSAVG
jgi:hypothetical protein